MKNNLIYVEKIGKGTMVTCVHFFSNFFQIFFIGVPLKT
jgi:hypothetical protein